MQPISQKNLYFFLLRLCIVSGRLCVAPIGYSFSEKVSLFIFAVAKYIEILEEHFNNFARVAPLDPAFSPHLNGGGYCPGSVSVFHCVYRHSLGYQACSCYAHFMPMLCPRYALMMFLLCAILWAWCGHGSIALQNKKRTGAGVRKEGLYYAGKGESRSSAGGSLPLHDSSGYKGNREREGQEQKVVACLTFWLFLQKTFYIIYLLTHLLFH